MELYLDDKDTEERMKQQLTMYKSLNHDLSKKVQELKIELSENKNQFAICHQRLLEEQQRVKEYKRCLSLINLQCFQFSSNYYNIVNEINEQNPNVSMEFPNEGRQSAEESLNSIRPKSFIRPPRRQSLPNDAEMLGAITEESMQTSTPFLRNNTNRKFGTNIHLNAFDSTQSSSSDDTINGTPKKVTGSRSRRLSDRLSSIGNDNEEPPQQSPPVTQNNVLEEVRECSVEINLLRASEVQRYTNDQPDSGINEDENTPPSANSSKMVLQDYQEESSSNDEEEITQPKKVVVKKVRKGKAKTLPKKKSQKKAEKENESDNEERNLKRKKTASESSEECNGRAKRQKRKDVVYTEPSLGTKLRRPKNT